MLGTCRGSQVAIKQIDLSKTDQEELLAEIRILSAERQANIVMLMGVCEYTGEDVRFQNVDFSLWKNVPQLLILTEYCPRGDLRRILEDPAIHIPVSRAIQFAIGTFTENSRF
jgi:serine/threonine protein kinase